jgi:transcriptional regulator with XRE-family HTH domain
MVINAKKFGESLRDFRRNSNLNQEDIAGIVGCTHSKISRIEQGSSDVTLDYLELNRLIKHFDLSSEALMIRCEFIKRKREPGIATKIIQLFEEIKKEYEGEREVD